MMKKTVESIEGKRFKLQRATGKGRAYKTAIATCPDDIPDENWRVPVYRIYWDIDGWDVVTSWTVIGTVKI